MEMIPEYWKSEVSDVEETVRSIVKGEVSTLCQSPGGRNVYLVFYGKHNDLGRTANVSSALGARDISCYADRTRAGYRPTLLLVGATHGGEMEGIVALLNLISILETGVDKAGVKHASLRQLAEQCNLLIVPCLNPDGRARVPLKSFVGERLQTLRHYNQGTKKDGSNFDWPDCKKIHPIKEASDFLGGYFNDDGVNLMHDRFFTDAAAESRAILKIAEDAAPDFTVLLHGGAHPPYNYFIKPTYVPRAVKENIERLEEQLEKRCGVEGLHFKPTGIDSPEDTSPPAAFNLTSALYHVTAAPCVTYECNQGLIAEGADTYMSYEAIYRHHMLLIEGLCAFISEGK